ncbi:hypothetical protein HELRODRAFT_156059 [Helobdella robusta]|uniref:NADPH:adrenodoxin oxidoreductase, mitochondrial n=1 Tax=Helobdella robusta TaxID=6412 RepID=T1ELR2_HELRO|nr:hypothetical protein HELRODRAFT_156059 [Helobdella robusta]ESN94409.1 hypothetical protein HELRODRAFT_156059 [Helobdella robusta]
MASNKSRILVLMNLKRFLSSFRSVHRIAIIGAGPGGFYAAQQICKAKNIPSVEVDIFEKFPVPFGLVRYGVAPDHPEVKNVTNTFTKIVESLNVNFYGNMVFGKNLSLKDLKKCYSGVILSYGSSIDKHFNIPGEKLNGVLPASDFVNWYNGTPGYRNVNMNFNADSCVILGQGNVAIDVARILLSPISALEKTDIANYALEKLSESKIKVVYLVGRRGPIQASFTVSEFREISKLSNCRLLLNKSDFAYIRENAQSIPTSKKRLVEFQIKKVSEDENVERTGNITKGLHILFKRSPLKFVNDVRDPTSVASVLFSVNMLPVIKSIGYKSQQLDPEVPFDEERGLVPNHLGRVLGKKGLYCSGWLKTGPVGVLVSTMNSAFETGKSVVEDIKSASDALFAEKGLVTFDDWKILNEIEIKRGLERGKSREKLTEIAEMLQTLNKKSHD